MRIDRYPSIDPVAAEWDELADRTAASPFLRPGWIGAWWTAFGAGALEVVAVRDGDELAAVLPLVRHRGVLRSPANWHTPEFGPVGTPEGIAAAYDAVLRSRAPFVQLRFLDEPAPLEERAAAARRPSEVRVLQRSPYIPLTGEVRRPRAKKLDRLRAALGDVELEVRDGSEELDESLRLAFRLEGSGWKVEQGTAILSSPQTERFYTDVAHWAAGRGMLRLFFIRVGDATIAAEYKLVDDRRVYDVKGGYDPAYKKQSPGFVSMDLAIAWAKEQGYETYEFLGADEGWKLEWSELVRVRHEASVFPAGTAGKLVHRAYAEGRPLAKRALALARRR